MDLEITIGQTDASLVIREKAGAGDFIDEESLSFYHDLDWKLLFYLDKLLVRNKMEVGQIKSYQIKSGLGEESTSLKIAQALVKGLEA